MIVYLSSDAVRAAASIRRRRARARWNEWAETRRDNRPANRASCRTYRCAAAPPPSRRKSFAWACGRRVLRTAAWASLRPARISSMLTPHSVAPPMRRNWVDGPAEQKKQFAADGHRTAPLKILDAIIVLILPGYGVKVGEDKPARPRDYFFLVLVLIVNPSIHRHQRRLQLFVCSTCAHTASATLSPDPVRVPTSFSSPINDDHFENSASVPGVPSR